VLKCNQENLAAHLHTLLQLSTMTTQHYKELEAIDQSLTKILLHADRACLPPNPAPWSPALNQAYLRHCVWSVALSAHRTKRDMDNVISALRARLKPSPEDALELTRSILASLCHAQKALRKAKCEAAALWKAHLEALLNKARATNEKKKLSALTYLICAEQNRPCYAAFRQHTKPKLQGGLGYITVSHRPDQPPQIILDQEEMNDTLLEHSRTHFAKAQGSPFTVEPLMHLLHYDGLTPLGNQVLKGCADLDSLSLDRPTKALLHNMRDKMPSPTLHEHPLQYEDLACRIKKWKESTTTSPSGHHLGIYKSLLCHVLNDKDQKEYRKQHPSDLIIQGKDVLHLVFDIMTLALCHTYMLERWQKVWTIFIEKELGNPDLARLQCIMLFEADYRRVSSVG